MQKRIKIFTILKLLYLLNVYLCSCLIWTQLTCLQRKLGHTDISGLPKANCLFGSEIETDILFLSSLLF